MNETELSKKKTRSRELELARRLQSVIEGLPSIALNNLLQNIQSAIANETGDNVNSGHSSDWQVVHCDPIHILASPTIAVEIYPNDSRKDRFDLVVAIPSIQIKGKLFTNIIFELKLAGFDKKQLDRYCKSALNSLLISICVSDEPAASLQSSEGELFWIHQTWEQLYFSLQSMLSGDAQPRITQVEEPDNLVLKFDHRIAGQDREAFAIESLLEVIEARGLLPNKDLTLVVPLGKPASDSLNFEIPYYAHPLSWRSGYRYLVTVKGNAVDALYHVVESVSTEPISGETPIAPIKLPQRKWEELCRGTPLRVSVLSVISGDRAKIVGRKYVKQGARGGASTFTQTHRYLKDLDELTRYFNDGSNNA